MLHATSPVVAGLALGLAVLALVWPARQDRAAPPPAAQSPAAVEALDALAFRIALLEQRTAGATPASGGAAARDLVMLVALQEIAERVERGLPFDASVATLGAAAPPSSAAALQVLALHAPRGVATQRRLEADFARLRPMLEAQVAAPGSGFGRAFGLLQGVAADLHLIERPPADAAALAIARIGAVLPEARLAEVLAAAAPLDGATRQMAGAWLMTVRARDDVLSSIEQLRRSTWPALARFH